jgi:hypothetical protein
MQIVEHRNSHGQTYLLVITIKLTDGSSAMYAVV